MPPEMVVQAETRFSESPFVQECLEWHNNYRRKHLAPDLTLDPPVSTFILGYIKDYYICNQGSLLYAITQHWANIFGTQN